MSVISNKEGQDLRPSGPRLTVVSVQGRSREKAHRLTVEEEQRHVRRFLTLERP